MLFYAGKHQATVSKNVSVVSEFILYFFKAVLSKNYGSNK